MKSKGFALTAFFAKLKRVYNYASANKSYANKRDYLREQGAQIGEGTRLICKTDSFGSEPYLVRIGNNCLISSEVRFFTHDGGVKVLSDLNYFNGQRMDIMAPITIGSNVYIGTGAYILPGVTIGDNVVIGAAAVVTRDIPSNSVAVGMPARVIKTIDEYYENAVAKGHLYPTAQMTQEEKKEFYKGIF